MTLDKTHPNTDKSPLSWFYCDPQLYRKTYLWSERSRAQLFLSTPGDYGKLCSCCMDVLYPMAAAVEQGHKNNPVFTGYPYHFGVLFGGAVANWEDTPHWTGWIPEVLMRKRVREELMQIFFFIQWLTRHFSSSLSSRNHLRSKTLALLSTFFLSFFLLRLNVCLSGRRARRWNTKSSLLA